MSLKVQTYERKLGVPLSNGKEILIGPIPLTGALTVSNYALHQNFSDLIGDKTAIGYAVASNAEVIRIDNVARQGAETLVNKQKSPGCCAVSWKLADVPRGVCFWDPQVVTSPRPGH